MSFVSGLGRINIDLLYGGVNRLPKEGEEIYSKDFSIKLGGGTPATLVWLSRLNIPTKLLTYYGEDMFSRFALERLSEEGVEPIDFSETEGFPINVTSAIVTQSDRTFISYGKEELPTDRQKSLLLEQSRGAKIVVMQYGFSEVYRQLKKEGAILAFDFGYREDMCLETYGEYLSLADYFAPNKQEALKLTKTSSVEEAGKILSRYLSKVIIKLGDEGCFYMEDGKTGVIPYIGHYRKVDATGAGDAFLGGFLYGVYNGLSFTDSIVCGNIVGGKCVTELGCLTATVTEEELLSLSRKKQI